MLKVSDEAASLDFEIESFVKTLEKKILELNPDFDYNVTIKHNSTPIEDATLQFLWDDAKIPKEGKTVDELIKNITEKLENSKKNFKNKNDEYQLEKDKLKIKMRSDVFISN